MAAPVPPRLDPRPFALQMLREAGKEIMRRPWGRVAAAIYVTARETRDGTIETPEAAAERVAELLRLANEQNDKDTKGEGNGSPP